MAFFDNLKLSLKQKWLQFFEMHQSWINLQMDVESVSTPDGGKRPASYFILGVINALEPQLSQLMPAFTKLSPNVDDLIEVLELNFDPHLVLANNLTLDAVLETASDDSLALSEQDIAMMLQQHIDDQDMVIQVLTDLDLDNLSDTSAEMTEELGLSSVTAQQIIESAQLNSEKSAQAAKAEISRLFPNF